MSCPGTTIIATLRRRTRRGRRDDRTERCWPLRILALRRAAGSKNRLCATVVSIRIAHSGTAHQRRRIDEISIVGVDDDRGSRIHDGDSVRALRELCFVAVARHAHPDVEVWLGLRGAIAAGVLDGEVLLESLLLCERR